MRGLLRRLPGIAGALALAAGAGAFFFLDTPVQAVAPLRATLAGAGAILLLLAAVAWRVGMRRLGLAFGPAGAIALSVAAILAVQAPRCEPFTADNGEVRLAGTACVPASSPAPTAVFVHGSGRVTRDEFRYYAETLAKRGVAAVIYDKRGAGRSTGDTYAVGYEGYAEDLVAVTRWARAQPFARRGAVGFVGYSEAEWVMPLAAARAAPDFIVVVGASGLAPQAQVAEEIALRLRAAGFGASEVASAVAVNRQLGDYVAGRLDAEAFREVLDKARREPWFGPAGDLPDGVYPREQYAWWARVMDFDPGPAWSGYGGPVLFLKGTADDRSDAHASAARFRRFFPADGAGRLDVRLLEGADHVLLLWPMGKGTPPPAFAPDYPAVLGDWILRQAGPAGPGQAPGTGG